MQTAFSDAFGVILIVYAGHMLRHRREFVVDGMSLLAVAVIIAVLLSLILIPSHKRKTTSLNNDNIYQTTGILR